MSRPPSRSSSYNVPPQPQPKNTAPLYISAGQAPSSPTHHQHTTTLGHKLRHMFDKDKYAVFVANVVVQELGNVPQIEGDFAVQWKFRGRGPKHADLTPSASTSSSAQAQGRLIPKASLPNVKTGTLASKHSDSTLSLRSTSTAASTLSSPLNPNRTNALTPNPQKPRGISKSHTLPPSALSSMTPIKTSPPRDKKSTDPTPLRQSSGTDALPGLVPMESPEQLLVEEPEEEENGLGFAEEKRKSSGESSRTGGSGSSRIPSIGLTGPAPEESSFYAGTIPRMGSEISLESENHLSVPFPKPRLTSSSEEKLSRPSVPRRKSTDLPSSSQTSLPSFANSLHLFKPRQRSSSGLTVPKPSSIFSSTSRKGMTQTAALHAHSCSWNYELQYPIKVPLTKQVSASGTTTPSSSKSKPVGPSAPILGAGPLSDSGIRLIIEQIVQPKKEGEEADGRTDDKAEQGRERKASLERVRFGVVDIDLAGFAGKGRTTRRFLLRGSRTNATIRVTVDMKWIGGEENWIAPPMQTGHFVTGMADLVGETDNLRNDLLLSKSPSNSSASSQVSSISGLASNQSSLAMSRNASDVSLVGPAPNLAYKSFEHHLLKPEDINSEPRRRRTSSKDSRASTPDGKLSKRTNLESIPGTPADQVATNEAQSPVAASIRSSRFKRTHHHHHSHHFRMSFDGFNDDSKSNVYQLPKTVNQSWGIQDLPADVIVEAVWNPHPGMENGPFTFIPQQISEESLNNEQVEAKKLGNGDEAILGDGAEAKEVNGGGRRSWVRRRKSIRREKTRDKIVTI